MAKIGLEKVEFYAYHGYSVEERKVGCRFELDIEVDLDLDQNNWEDNISHTLNYQSLYTVCKEIMKIEQRLIETVAIQIVQEIKLLDDRINSVKVKIKKLDPPIHGHIRNAFVEIEC